MAREFRLKLKLIALFKSVRAECRDLDTSDPSQWPRIPRNLLFGFVSLTVVIGLWFLWVSVASAELGLENEKEVKLREEFTRKLGKSNNLDALKRQRTQVEKYVTQLEGQLPGKAEMGALLSDINQAGIGRSLQFDLFRPGQVTVKDYYAELPIAVRVTGRYQDMGSFAADIAKIPRIVTLNNLHIVPFKDGTLTMDAIAKTFRGLDEVELAAQQKALAPNGVKK